jgi:hypothetical protein
MYPVPTPAQQTTNGKKEKWSKLTYDQRMGVLVQTIQILRNVVVGYEKTINDLRRHKHNEEGRPYITKEIDGGYGPQEVTEGPGSRITHLPIDNFDFEELKII